MSLLRRLPRWLRIVLLGLDLAAATAVLVAYWWASYPNLIAAWFQLAAVAAVAVPFGAWLGRRLDERQEHVARRVAEHTEQHLAEHHEATRAHLTEQITAVAAGYADTLATISGQVAALHARLDQQGGATHAADV